MRWTLLGNQFARSLRLAGWRWVRVERSQLLEIEEVGKVEAY